MAATRNRTRNRWDRVKNLTRVRCDNPVPDDAVHEPRVHRLNDDSITVTQQVNVVEHAPVRRPMPRQASITNLANHLSGRVMARRPHVKDGVRRARHDRHLISRTPPGNVKDTNHPATAHRRDRRVITTFRPDLHDPTRAINVGDLTVRTRGSPTT